MKIETASFLKSSVVSGLSCLLLAGALCASSLVTTGCKSSASGPDGGNPGLLDTCTPNVMSSAATASPLTAGTSYNSKICYEGTSNWYVITVPSGSTLLDVAAGYPMTANTSVDLDVKVFFQTNATTLTQVQELVAPAQSDAGIDSIQTTLQVLQAGSYYIQIADAHGMAFDATNSYTLAVGYATDPDTHEPNDTIAAAKASDGKPGWLAYLGDLDIFVTTAASANDLLTINLNNPAMASSQINYTITNAMGTTLGEGMASPAAMPFNTTLPVTAAGMYYITLSYPMGAIPDRSMMSGYTLAFGTMLNPDNANNHTIATATCPGGGTGPCTMAYSGTQVTLPPQMGFTSVPGQRDFYRVDVTSGAALVLQANLTSASPNVKYAIDLLTPDPSSACKVDADCNAINATCSKDTDCELSHHCLSAGNYGFCPTNGVACQLCEGAGICIPSGASGGVCAIAQYLSSYTGTGTVMGSANVSTAQPLFSNGPYYVNVHDAQYTNVDSKNPYTLQLQMAPEPDPNDKSTTAAMRNNFYNPYPTAMSDLSPNKSRAIDITAQVNAALDGGTGKAVTGYISYQTDEDWFSFQHPCPGQNCGVNFSWVQPGPSNVSVAFFMLNEDLSLHESFGYDGMTPTTSLAGPVTSTFANADCSTCSFAAATMTGSPYTYYLRIADLKQNAWDFSGKGQYSFMVSSITAGCPAACNQAPGGMACVCYCASTMSCPAPKQ